MLDDCRQNRYIAVGCLSGIVLGLVPAISKAYLNQTDLGLFLPFLWISGWIAVSPPILLATLILPSKVKLFVRIAISVLSVTTASVYEIGFDRTGDWIRFILFELYLDHPLMVKQDRGGSVKVYAWRNWGIVGSENDAYLASQGSFDLKSQSISGSKFSCPIVDAEPLIPPWWIIVTYNCSVADADLK